MPEQVLIRSQGFLLYVHDSLLISDCTHLLFDDKEEACNTRARLPDEIAQR